MGAVGEDWEDAPVLRGTSWGLVGQETDRAGIDAVDQEGEVQLHGTEPARGDVPAG